MKVFLLACILIVPGIPRKVKKYKAEELVGKKFFRSGGYRKTEYLDFKNDSTCYHFVISQGDTINEESIGFQVEKNMIYFDEIDTSFGHIKYPSFVIMRYDPAWLERQFYGPEFGSSCFIEWTNKKGKRFYIDDVPR